jgi:hypothetical protein
MIGQKVDRQISYGEDEKKNGKREKGREGDRK